MGGRGRMDRHPGVKTMARKSVRRSPAPRRPSRAAAGRKTSKPKLRPPAPRAVSAPGRTWIHRLQRWVRQTWQSEPETLGFGLLFLLAALLRFWRPDWYADRQFHPDERWIFGVVSSLSYPNEPLALQYGTFPLYLLACFKDVAAALAGFFGPFDASRFVIWAGRSLSAVFDLGTLTFTYLLGRRLLPPGTAAGRRLGLWAAAFLAFTVLHIQMSHFFVVDVALGLLTVATLYGAVGIALTGERKDYLWTGACLGLALATKTSALPLGLAVLSGHILGWRQADEQNRVRRWKELGYAVALAVGTFFLAMPYAILDWGKFWANQNEQSRILVTGTADVPYNRQYLHTLPYFYYAKNLIRYLMGFPLGSLSLAGFVGYPAWIVSRIWGKTEKNRQSLITREAGWLVVMSFGLAYAVIIGNSFAKFNRYLIPLTPVLCLLAGRMLHELSGRLPRTWGDRVTGWLGGAILGFTIFWAMAFFSIYQAEHPWVAASRWMMKHIPSLTQENGFSRQTAILNEEWGDDLPVGVEGFSTQAYRNNKFSVQEPDTPRKREIILNMLQTNDWIVMADTRAHAVYRRLPDRYPINAAYYELMFEEKLGFSLAREFSNYPRLGAWVFPDDAADESFTLYDHPHVYLFQRQKPPLSAAELSARLDERVKEIQGRKPGAASPVAEKKTSVRPSAARLRTVVNANLGARLARPDFIFGTPNSATVLLAWLCLIEVIGLLSLPLVIHLFPRLPDAGAGMAKIIGTLLFTWCVWMLVSLGVVEHCQETSLAVLLAMGTAAGVWALRRRTEVEEFFRSRRREWLVSEGVFLLAFVGYALTKMYNPDIHNPFGQGYNGGGEPMGMTFFSAVYHSLHFPPYDPWLSGYPINYYYYGQVILGILAKLIGAPPAWSYQVVLSLLFAFTVTGVYSLGFGMTGRRIWGGLAAAAAAAAGNLHTFFYLLEPVTRATWGNDGWEGVRRLGASLLHQAGRFEFIWNPTRLIKGTINEMPWFSFLYGDLHAHIIAMPFSLPMIAWALNVLQPSRSRNILLPEAPGRTVTERGLTFFIIALTLGSLSAINTWNFPPYALMALAVLAGQAWQEHKAHGLPWRAWFQAGMGWLRLVLGGLLLFFFFHKNFIPQSNSLAWVNPEVRTRVREFLQFFGLVVFAVSTFAAQAMLPVLREGLRALGWKSKSRQGIRAWRSWLELPQLLWERRPVVFYTAASLLVAASLLAFFGQTLQAVLGGLLLVGVWGASRKNLSPSTRLAWILTSAGFAVVMGCEWVHVRDFMGVGGDMSRMNTVFKFYMVVWIWFALAAVFFLSQVISRTRPEEKKWLDLFRGREAWQVWSMAGGVWLVWGGAYYAQEFTGVPWLSFALSAALLGVPWVWVLWPKALETRRLWAAVLVALAAVVSLYPAVSVYNRMRLCSEFKNPTLNGIAYLERMRPREAKALAWLREHVRRIEIVLEAPGRQGYNCFDTRVAVFTGLPTLIGWIGQEEQMRYNDELTGSHTRDANAIYETMDIPLAQRLLRKYQVQYVFVGENEQAAYPAPGLRKFEAFLDKVYDQDGIRIYRQPRSPNK